MISYVEKLVKRYGKSGILVDTNILLLYFVGLCDPNKIKTFKRIKDIYTTEDYSAIITLLSHFNKKITTPNILTEVSNLAGQLTDPFKSQFFKLFGKEIQVLDEYYIDSSKLSETNQFIKFGLTDSVIIQLLKNKYLLLTDDFKLAGYLQKENVDVINFNNIRPYYWH